MKTRLLKVFFIVAFVLAAVFPALPVQAAEQRIGSPAHVQAAKLPTFSDFINSVSDGTSNVIRGVYVPNLFAFRVIQQPSKKFGYVSTIANAVTQFSLAYQNGVTGLLAHNYLAGSSFSSLTVGQDVHIVYGDGHVAYYQVSSIYQYQAVSPTSATSNFIDLANNNEYSASQIFNQFYTGSDHVTFQTCIANGREKSWGRLFIVALPMETSLMGQQGN